MRPFALPAAVPAVVLALAGLGGCQGDHSGSPAASRLALVTIEAMSDDDAGCAGNPRARTPWLDRLARTGLQARDARTPARPVRATLASALTGAGPDGHGLARDELALDPAVPTVAGVLARDGVRTAAFPGTAAADRRHGLGRGFAFHPLRFDPRDLEDWLAEGDPAFAWVHLGEARDEGPAGADAALGQVLRTLGPDAFVVVAGTGRDGAGVPFVVRSPDVPAGIRRGATSITDAAAVLGAARAGEPLLADALADPPADRVVTALPTPPLATGVDSLVTAARDHERAGRPGEARAAWTAAFTAEPGLVAARARAAELAFRDGDAPAAASLATGLLALVPDHPEARVLLARLLVRRKDEAARPLLDGVLAESPHHPGALVLRAELALEAGDPARAVRDLRLALVAAGEDPGALLDVARGLSRAGLHEDAVRTAQRAIGRDDSPFARYTLAFVLERAERYPEAVREYARLVRTHPGYLPPYRNLGALMARDGELERAIDLWERGLAHNPGDPSLTANLEAARRALGLATLGG
jgi:tetratricopeptide (TPR) repeat protein